MYNNRNNNKSRFNNRGRNNKFSRFNNARKYNHKSFDPRAIIARMKLGIPDETVSKEKYEIKNAFADFNLDMRLATNIGNRNFSAPTPIQDQAIPEILEGHDVVGVANTGTGKTAAFLIPLINKFCLNRNSKVLIIAPTRELAIQIDKELIAFSKKLGIHSTVCIGGVNIKPQIRGLERNPQFVIGTPGRLLDLENQRKINFNRYNSIVLDEVDRMLDMGFVNDINKIISKLPRNRQSLFFSATLDDKIKNVMRKFITNPVMISVKTADTAENVSQDVVELRGRNKQDVLCDILDEKGVIKTLIFTRTKRGADMLHKNLTKERFLSTAMHGNKSQNQRQRSLEQFRMGKVDILIATDVASRGIDIDDITHVINYDLPETYDDYIHRIGRTGRANKKGIALTLI